MKMYTYDGSTTDDGPHPDELKKKVENNDIEELVKEILKWKEEVPAEYFEDYDVDQQKVKEALEKLSNGVKYI